MYIELKYKEQYSTGYEISKLPVFAIFVAKESMAMKKEKERKIDRNPIIIGIHRIAVCIS